MNWQDAMDLLYHPNAAKVLKQEIAAIEEARQGVTDEERREYLIGAEKDPQRRQEVAEARLIRVSNDVLAHTWALSFLELQTLGDAEWPVLTNRKRDKNYTVTYLGENMGAARKQRVERYSTLQLLMKQISTEVVEWPLVSLQVGSVDQGRDVEQELSYELDLKIDQEAKAVLDSAAITSGLRATLNLHPAIISANIPDANHLDHSGVGTSGVLDVEKFKRLLDYFERFAADVELDRTALGIKAIYLPSTVKRQIWDFVDLVAGFSLAGAVQDPKNTIPTEARMEIWRSAKLESMFGYRFAIVTRNTLATPYAYVSSNKPAGFFWITPLSAIGALRQRLSSCKKRAIPSESTIEPGCSSFPSPCCFAITALSGLFTISISDSALVILS